MKTELESDFSICRTVEQSFTDYKKFTTEKRDEIYNPTLKSVLENNDQFVSVWLSWELSAIDKNYKKEHGRQSVAFFKEKNEIGYSNYLEDTAGNPSGLYYEIKANPSEILTDPYYYSYSGNKEDEILEASVCIPMYEKGEFIGLVGADIELERFQDILSHFNPFEGSFSVLVSSEGIMFSHSSEEVLNNTVKLNSQ